MAKKRDERLDVGGDKPNLGHNPFAALAHLADQLPPGGPVAKPHPVALAPKATGGRIVLRRETKHRGGKTVIVLSGFGAIPGLSPQGRAQLAHELKVTLGCGGTVEDGDDPHIVLQNDDPARIAQLLMARGYRVAGTVR